MALEPQWEAKFEASSYGFRPKRNCHDAIEGIFNTVKGTKKQWVFEGDFKGCFDNLSHEYILNQLKGFPEINLIAKWLKAGFVDNNVFNETDEGTPQGGSISPLLANIALHGMEEALGIEYTTSHSKGKTRHENRSQYAMARYADDFVIMCATEKEANDLYNKLKPYLEKRGLELAQEKTKVTHITDGFDFLGFNVRKYTTENGTKLLCKPSKDSIKKAKLKITETARMLHGNNAQILIDTLNPIIIGTANYWSSVVSSEIFNRMDNHIWTVIYTFLRRLHPKKNWGWIKARYFKPDKTGQSKDKWILTDPDKANQLKKMSWTPIVRHTKIKHTYSPYDVLLKDYFVKRDIKEFDRNNVAYRQKLAKRQKYKCPLCGQSVTDFRQGLETHHKIPKHKGGSGEYKNLILCHSSCHTEYHRIFPVKGDIPNDKQIRESLKHLK
jgi:RNA-directed DNA polymerase